MDEDIKVENSDLQQTDFTKPENAKDVPVKLYSLINGKYPIEVEGLGKLLIKKPTTKEHTNVEAFKATEILRVAKEYPSLLTERKLKKVYKEANIWTEEDEDELDAVSKALALEEETLQDMLSPVKEKIQEEITAQDKIVTKLRKQKAELLGEKNRLFGNCLENVVNNVAHMFMTWQCIYGEDEKRKFKNLDEMLEISQEQLTQLNIEVWKILLGLRNDFLDSKPAQPSGE